MGRFQLAERERPLLPPIVRTGFLSGCEAARWKFKCYVKMTWYRKFGAVPRKITTIIQLIKMFGPEDDMMNNKLGRRELLRAGATTLAAGALLSSTGNASAMMYL